MIKLQIYKKDELVRELELEKESYTIGRDPKCDIPLNDNFISRRHARIKKSETGWGLEDLGSTNGTFIGKKKVTRQNLSGGEEIVMGPFRIVFQEALPVQEATRVAPAEERKDQTEGRDKILQKPVEVLNGKDGVLLLGPDGSRGFYPLSEKPKAVTAIPPIHAEIAWGNGKIILRFPSEKRGREMVLQPGWQNLPSGHVLRPVRTGEIISLLESASGKAPRKIRPAVFLIPVLGAIILFLLLPARTLQTWKEKYFPSDTFFATGPDASSPEPAPGAPGSDSIPPPAPNLPAGSTPVPGIGSPPPPLNPQPEVPAARMLLPPPLPRFPASQPGPAPRTTETVYPSEPMSADESRPDAPAMPDRLARGFQAYEEGKLGQAREEWTSLARKIPPGEPDREKALRLARLAGQLRGELLLVQEAERQKNLKTARAHFEEARKLDGVISPEGKSRVLQEARERLSGFAAREGDEALRQGDFPEAFLRFREALDLVPGLTPARNGLALLTEKAQVLFREAYHLESANREEAMGKYRLILRMLPPENEYFKKASRRLEAGP